MNAVTLSIVIVNFETAEHTLQCLRSIRENPPTCEYETIVIDSGSCDGSLERIREEAPWAHCIAAGANVGFSRANNLGIHNSRGAFVLLLNSDTKILDDTLDRMLEYLLANSAVGAVGPRQLDGEGRLQLSWGAFPTFVSEILRKILHHRLSADDFRVRDYLEERYAGTSPVDWISGSCLMARKRALTDAGLLDEAFFMYFEDIDLCRRIREAGWTIHHHSDWKIIHYGGVSAKKNLLRVTVEYRRSQLYFTRKYYGRGGVAVLRAFLFAKYTLYLLNSTAAFSANRLLGRDASLDFARLLLSKKSLEIALGREPAR